MSGGLIAVLENIYVKNLIISKQASISNEYTAIINLCKKRRVKIVEVKNADVIKIDRKTKMVILHPEEKLLDDSKGGLNINAITAKLSYQTKKGKQITMLLTGDIEQDAEKYILQRNSTNNLLQADILKVGHHRIENL